MAKSIQCGLKVQTLGNGFIYDRTPYLLSHQELLLSLPVNLLIKFWIVKTVQSVLI